MRHVILILTLLAIFILPASHAFALEATLPVDKFNLLENLDTDAASVQGTWSLAKEGLRVEAQTSARLMFPHQNIPDSYILRVAFTRVTGQHSIAIILPTAKGQCSLDLDAWGQHLAGFQLLNNQRLNQREPRVSLTLQNSTRYEVDVIVLHDLMTVNLNGKLLLTQPLDDDTRLSMLDLWRLPRADALGIGAYDAATVFHEVTLTRLNPEAMQEIKKETPAAPVVAQEPPATTAPATPAAAASDTPDTLASLSDDFSDPATLNNWQRIYRVEQSPADQVARVDINRTRQGWLTVVPHASSWFKDYRGVLFFKPVTGNVVVTMHVNATSRRGDGPPASEYSLMGIMMRAPRTETPVTPQTWRPGQENYIFLSVGSANQPGSYQYEVKNTVNSDSRLAISRAPSGIATLRAVRVGSSLIVLRQSPGQPWVVHQRYNRPDFPATLQIGLTTYTDWQSVQRLQPRDHNTRVIQGGNPDLRAQVDYIHFNTPPALPAPWQNADLSDPSQASDAQVIEWLKALDKE